MNKYIAIFLKSKYYNLFTIRNFFQFLALDNMNVYPDYQISLGLDPNPDSINKDLHGCSLMGANG